MVTSWPTVTSASGTGRTGRSVVDEDRLFELAVIGRDADAHETEGDREPSSMSMWTVLPDLMRASVA